MNNYDFIQISRFINRKASELENQIADFEHKFNTFRKFDELDAVDLHKMICQKEFLDNYEIELLKLCDYLLIYNNTE